MSKLYGVGVGPGDPELITVKAARVLAEADIAAVPKMANGERTAFNIARRYLDGKLVLDCVIPMTRDAKILAEAYAKAADDIEGHLKQEKTVAFITLGDPGIYSSYMRISRMISSRGYDTELVAGVTSFCAAAARLNISLCEHGEPLIIIPSGYEGEDELLGLSGTKVIMKAGSNIRQICGRVNRDGISQTGMMVEKCGMEGEKIYQGFDSFPEKAGYLSTVIVKDKSDD